MNDYKEADTFPFPVPPEEIQYISFLLSVAGLLVLLIVVALAFSEMRVITFSINYDNARHVFISMQGI